MARSLLPSLSRAGPLSLVAASASRCAGTCLYSAPLGAKTAVMKQTRDCFASALVPSLWPRFLARGPLGMDPVFFNLNLTSPLNLKLRLSSLSRPRRTFDPTEAIERASSVSVCSKVDRPETLEAREAHEQFATVFFLYTQCRTQPNLGESLAIAVFFLSLPLRWLFQIPLSLLQVLHASSSISLVAVLSHSCIAGPRHRHSDTPGLIIFFLFLFFSLTPSFCLSLLYCSVHLSPPRHERKHHVRDVSFLST